MQVDVEMQPAFLQGNDFQLWDESISMHKYEARAARWIM